MLLRRPEGIGEALKKILKDMEKADPDIIGSVVVRSDGLILAHAVRGDIDADLAAAMIASVLSISNRVLEELKIGQLEDIVIKAKEGILATVPVTEDVVLGVIAKSGANLGLLLLTMGKTRDKIKSTIEKL